MSVVDDDSITIQPQLGPGGGSGKRPEGPVDTYTLSFRQLKQKGVG